MSTDLLKAKVERREKFISFIIESVGDCLLKYGKVVSEEVHSCHIRALTILTISNFYFVQESGLSMYGGATLKIFFKGKSVLEIYWQDKKKVEVSVFVDDIDWQNSLKKVIKDPEKSFAIIKKAQDKLAKDEQRKIEAANNEISIRETAKRLGL